MKKSKTGRGQNRKTNELRLVKIETGVNIHAEGSALISMGNTRVICTASVEEKVPPFLRDKNTGWITSEYSMLPRATSTRSTRESVRGRPDGRTMEIQRLIGRALRAVVDLEGLGKRTIWVDCDVIQADGGTRTASVTGGFVAMYLAIEKLKKERKIPANPVKDYLAAVSVGVVDGKPMLDLTHEEDYAASTDMNVVMTGKGKYVELQSTAEKEPFGKEELERLIELAAKGIRKLINEQKKAIKKAI